MWPLSLATGTGSSCWPSPLMAIASSLLSFSSGTSWLPSQSSSSHFCINSGYQRSGQRCQNKSGHGLSTNVPPLFHDSTLTQLRGPDMARLVAMVVPQLPRPSLNRIEDLVVDVPRMKRPDRTHRCEKLGGATPGLGRRRDKPVADDIPHHQDLLEGFEGHAAHTVAEGLAVERLKHCGMSERRGDVVWRGVDELTVSFVTPFQSSGMVVIGIARCLKQGGRYVAMERQGQKVANSTSSFLFQGMEFSYPGKLVPVHACGGERGEDRNILTSSPAATASYGRRANSKREGQRWR